MRSFLHAVIATGLLLGTAFANAGTPASDKSAPSFVRGSPVLRRGTGIERLPHGVDLLRYIARCALLKGDHLRVSNNGKDELLNGKFGLADDWKSMPLSGAGKRWISACLLANVNAFGEHVMVSFRANHTAMAKTVTPEEIEMFSEQEGAFYGDIFADPPVVYACRGDSTSTSPARQKRVCTDAATGRASVCGMQVVGVCRDVCDVQDPKDHHLSRCIGGDRTFEEVVTTFLPPK